MRFNEFLDDAKGDRLACGCGCGYGSRLEHWGDAQVVLMHYEIRKAVGTAVYTVSGARCPRHNAAVAKSEHSQHSIAQALDLALPADWPYLQFYVLCDETVRRMTGGQGGVGKYTADRFVHIDAGLGELPNRRWGV